MISDWMIALRHGRVAMSALASPAVPKFAPVGTARADRNPQTVALIRSDEALRGRITYTSPPSRARFSTYPATNLEPQMIREMQVMRDNGYPQLWADAVEQVLERDGHLGGISETRRLGVADKPFRVHPARQGDDTAQTIADFTTRVLDCVENFEQAIEDLLSAAAYGYSVAELVWSEEVERIAIQVDGKTVIVNARIPRIDWVHWKHVRFDLDTDEPYIWLKDGEYRMPPNKFIFHSASGTGVIVKRGFMGACMWLSAAKSWTQRDWLIYSKLRSIPHIFATYPEGETEYDVHRTIYEQILKDYGEGIPALVPNTLKIEHGPEPAGRTGDIQGSIIGWANTEMSKRILGSTLTVEVSGQGAWAAADTHRDAPYMRARADAKKLAATLRSQFLRAIVDVNKEELSRATGKAPEELLGCVSKCSWRIDREMAPTDRLQAWDKGVELGIELDEDQFLDEFGFNRPAKGGRAIKGKVTAVPSGGALVSAADVAKAGAPITSPTADAKNEVDAAKNGPVAGGTSDGTPAVQSTDKPASEGEVAAHPDESLNGA